MPNDRPREKRRVGILGAPSPSPNEIADSPDASYMMLRDADAARIADRAHTAAAAAAAAAVLNDAPGDADQPVQKFPKISARELADMADKSLNRVHALTERNVFRPAAVAAKRVGRLPSLTTLAGFGKRAPTEANDGGGGGGGRRGGASRTSGGLGRPRRKVEQATKVVYINDEAKNSHFPSNYVSTTKYSWLTALPMFLLEQFSRFCNAYFLIVGIGYAIDAVSPVLTLGRYATLGSLGIVIMISAIKEGIEDYHRYREDKRVNRAVTHIVGSNATENKWSSVRVGDIIKVYDKEHLPADLVFVASSNEDGLAYIETKQLDGESNLKVKVVPQAVSSAFGSDSSVLLIKGRIECETPNDRLYKFNGRIVLETVPSAVETPVNTEDSDESGEGDEVEGSLAGVVMNEPISLGPENLLIRGSSIQNTDWVMGIVVNTGKDTKLMQNVKPRPRKNSRLERETNRHYFIVLALQICVVIGLTIRSTQSCKELFPEQEGRQGAWYLLNGDDCKPINSFLRLFTFFITFSSLIPISLYVSMEIVRAFQVYFIEHDDRIVDPETKVRTEVRTSNLNEELGVIQHVFTDKTGTLTANRMDFKKCSIAGRVYEMGDMTSSGATSMRDLKEAMQAGPESSVARNFSVEELEAADIAFRLLSLCHSVVAESPIDDSRSGTTDEAMSTGSLAGRRRRLRRRRNRSAHESSEELESRVPATEASTGCNDKNRQSSSLRSGGASGIEEDQRYSSSLNDCPANSGTISYQASSPDEAALVNAARRQGYTYISRSNRDTVIDIFGKPESHILLETIEFDSTRKRMSIITRSPDGQVRIYTKGADAIIFARLAPGQSSEVTEQHLHEFAVEGLRTLCLAYANLSNDWFEDWHRRYRLANSEINDRETAVAAVVDEIECNLTLLGATAIEDKLQEGVPETLRRLEQAGVKVWVLTGDKQETAINIGLSCGAIDEGMDVVIINEDNVEDTAAQVDRALGRWSAMRTDPSIERKLGLVIDGQTLHYALEPELQNKLMVVTRMARSVIACRVSPKQKTEIVELVRRHEKEDVTLAIGDGANDVGMIQAAHVGVGIVGLEGQEAKLASDYSIGQFRFLARLMLVHGRWNYKRLAKMVLYTIYKHALFTLCELYWATVSAYSGQPLLDPWMAGLYSVLVTSLPPIVLGIFDQELVADYALAFPEIYAKGQRNSAFNFRVFLNWIISAIWQSAVIFYVCFWGFGDRPGKDGKMLGMWPFGVVVYSVVIINVHLVLLAYQSSWTKLTAGLFLLSFLSWFLIGPLFSWRPIALTGRLSPPLYAVVHYVFADPKFWLVLMLAPVLCVSPSLLWKYNKRRRRPNMKMLVQELLRSGKTREEITGEPQRPLFRVPSYDPNRPGTPTGPVTFLRREREYLFSGFNFDVGESGAVLRHAFHSSRRARRRRMRVLKRAGSDTELDVEGVKTVVPASPDYNDSMTGEWVNSRGESYYGDRGHNPEISSAARRRRPPRDRGEAYDIAMMMPDINDESDPGHPQGAVHRRAISDGAVLVENRYERLDQRQHDGVGYGGDLLSTEDEVEQNE